VQNCALPALAECHDVVVTQPPTPALEYVEQTRTWLDEGTPESGLFDPVSYPAAIHAAERVLASATTTYHLKNLRMTCEHNEGGELGEFHEFILLNAHDGVFTVLVASSTKRFALLSPVARSECALPLRWFSRCGATRKISWAGVS
jgi:hypothetical protein